MINPKEYETLLNNLISSIWQILPMYEEEFEGLNEHIHSLLLFEITAVEKLNPKNERPNWYLKTVANLTSLYELTKDNSTKPTHKQVKSKVFKMTNLIERSIKAGEHL